jgi:hypothetical protein
MDDQLKAIIDAAVADGVSDEDIDLLVKEHQARGPMQAPPQASQSLLDQIRGAYEGSDKYKYTSEHPVETAFSVSSPLIGGLAVKAGMRAAPVATRGAIAVLDNPIGGAIAGGIGGYATGGAYGAGIGAMGGLMGGGSKLADALRKLMGPNVAKGMSAAAPVADDMPPALKALMNGGNADDLAAAVSKPTAKAVAPTSRAFENELGKRIDWRTTDAVPIDAMKHAMGKGGSIIEAGESIPGLADRMAALLKQNTPTALQEAQTLAKALRQRGHITAKGSK